MKFNHVARRMKSAAFAGVNSSRVLVGCKPKKVFFYSSTSLVRGFWDEIFWPSKPRTTKEPRTKEGHIKVDIGTKFLLPQVIWWS